MSKRYNYKLNYLWQHWATLNRLHPLHVMEVVPGDSISGSFNWSFASTPTDGPVHNDVYMDVYAFYVPYRLCWTEWPDFISKRETGQPYENPLTPALPSAVPIWYGDTTPTDADHPFNELSFIMGGRSNLLFDGTNYGLSILPLWAYGIVYNTFFRRAGLTELVPVAQNTPNSDPRLQLLTVSNSHADFHRRAIMTEPPTSNSLGTTVASMREAIARERFEVIRGYYGDKYTDYLRSLGVDASMAVIDNPEPIGKASSQWKYKIIDNSGGWTSNPESGEVPLPETYALGNYGGYHYNNGTMSLSRKFFAEHGLVMVFGVNRIQTPNLGASAPLHAKRLPEDYWQPQYDRRESSSYPAGLWCSTLSGSAKVTDEIPVENYADYKAGHQINCLDIGPNYQPPNFPTAPNGQYVSQTPPETTVRSTIEGRYMTNTLLSEVQNPWYPPQFPFENQTFSFADATFGSGCVKASLTRLTGVSRLPTAL